MEFSKDSESIIPLLMDNFSSFHKKNTRNEKIKFDKILKDIYDKLVDANKKTRVLMDSLEFRKTIRKINKGNIQSNRFLPKQIENHILTKIIGEISYKCIIHNRDILFTFFISEHDMFDKTDDITAKMIMWLFFILPYTRAECSKTLKVTSYLTPFKKSLPENKSTVLGPNNVNTAFTYRCQENGEIIIFRKEEIFKVFLHETFHTLGLDWSDDSNSNKLVSNIKKLFPIPSDMKIAESYCEFWACFMNSAFTAYHLTDGYNVDEFLLYVEYCLSFEKIFSLLQIVKILRFMGLTYHDLHTSGKATLYKENTNVFVYYILKCIFLFNMNDFLNWCVKHNTNMIAFDANKDNFTKLSHFIKSRYNNKNFIHGLTQAKKLLNKYDSNFIKNTMRMSVFEFGL
jgi:hypothetical protein